MSKEQPWMVKSVPSAKPIWGKHYHAGWSGFSFTDDAFISEGIAVFENPLVLFGARVPSHTWIVTGPDECIEAQGKGVVRASMSERFANTNCMVWFRCPSFYDSVVAEEIVKGAEQELGKKYNYAMIGAHAASNTLIGRALNFITRRWYEKILTHIADKKSADICSMVTGYAMQRSHSLMAWLGSNRGVLAREAHQLKPSDLDTDRRIYRPHGFLLS
jgi:hypothetical protein